MVDVYDKDETFALCDSLGVVAVRERLKLNKFHIGQKPHVDAWLFLHESAARDRADERSEESLSIARKALCNSYWANAIAITAAIIAIIAIVIDVSK